ncbi:MAG TPA: hypothetical protein VFN10_16750 [Thermoanaerobaculia bacterium]|nr:hypothetical protein [Thermoanaerobaculia bacterium]
MFGRKKTARGTGAVDGGEGRGIPLGGHDQRPPTGYIYEHDEDEVALIDRADDADLDDLAFDGDGGPDRRRDPLRR